MFKLITVFLMALTGTAGAARAAVYNEWQVQQTEKMSQSGEKQHKRHRERVRIINMKDNMRRLIISCDVNSGRLRLNALFARGGEKLADKNGGKHQQTGLSLLIDNKPVLKDRPAGLKITPRGRAAFRVALQGEDAGLLISRFIAAKQNITVSFSTGAAETFSAANAAQAGLALQNCLYK